ncbi:hypothetical protein V1284_002012 [Nitrobacteraceae bacterium AZCC 2299]
MRGVIEAAAIGDFGNRMLHLGRIRQVGPSSLQASLAQIMRKTAAGAFEQFLQVALGDTLGLGHPRRRQIRIAEPALDGLSGSVLSGGCSP